ncbi:DUF6876 family protein [Aquimarina mytili]|uniref:DUF6876 domain-containing protein n=1 Tax=Aquimarina mytili TaxID=874423 RepID=A0A936ZWS1_9FLAO|nr:DUF6876 family protein [Aquimarina mytili]MBL0686103.1 hypothetical protein [Aquimarina mytili]
MNSPQVITNQLASYTYSELLFSSPETESFYTEGIERFSRICQCKWFIKDALQVCSKLKKAHLFITIDFKKTDNKAAVIYSDGGSMLLYRQEYDQPDFPLDQQRLFFCNNTLLLPSEW